MLGPIYENGGLVLRM